jgi:hypothetical protein
VIAASDWVAHAQNLLAIHSDAGSTPPSQVELRRAVSAAYYGLFHALTFAGSTVFASGGESLRSQAARAFSHTAMRKVCSAYVRSPLKPFPAGYEHLNEHLPSPELIVVARTFELLQENRFIADYDLLAMFDFQDAKRLVNLSEEALMALETVRTRPGTTVFLTALLLADRWTRRG